MKERKRKKRRRPAFERWSALFAGIGLAGILGAILVPGSGTSGLRDLILYLAILSAITSAGSGLLAFDFRNRPSASSRNLALLSIIASGGVIVAALILLGAGACSPGIKDF